MKHLGNYANAIYQNANVGKQSIHDILPSVKDKELEKELKAEYQEFDKVCLKLKTFAKENRLELSENNFMEKAKMWMSIKMSTTFNGTTRHIAELMILGTVMGLTTCYKDKFDHKNISRDLDTILGELEDTLENNYENLKSFLIDLNEE